MKIRIFIRRGDGLLTCYYEKKNLTKKQVVEAIKEFRRARRSVPRSSVGLWGNCFEKGSLRWIAGHSGIIEIYKESGEKADWKDFLDWGQGYHHRVIRFTQPYLRWILRYADNRR